MDFIEEALQENNLPATHTYDENGRLKFAKGNNFGNRNGKPKGSLNKKTLFNQLLPEASYEGFNAWLQTDGMLKLRRELDTLEGRDYISAIVALMPYFVAKIASKEATSTEEKIINIFGKKIESFTTKVTKKKNIETSSDDNIIESTEE